MPVRTPFVPEGKDGETLDGVKAAARACTACAEFLPLGPAPVLRGNAGARLLIVGQAPGTRVHATGIPWNDPSGERLRAWMGLDRGVFYDEDRIAIIPMGLCYPGRDPRRGDLPPMARCAPMWHPRLVPLLPELRLVLLVGAHAQRFYLGGRCGNTLTETVRNWRACGPDFLPLPHPSFRNNAWLKGNPWFEGEVVPHLRRRLGEMWK
ncbi:MAG: uracil-DNA glycosylase family protein [Candidatus Hydrogenedentes bacterium]|nr:uracil-DNA glycosylase family protein [Candidatus Hydrogenedentota bacterium]